MISGQNGSRLSEKTGSHFSGSCSMTVTMKATVSDIARSCGLSTATVDRVLNNRPGASAANRQRVMEAAKQLGYLPVVDQVALPSRPAHLEFFLPIGANGFMIDLAGHI